MKTVLVTGKIGSGKSEVCRYLSAKGWPVYDCDSRCKLLYEKVPGLKPAIEKELGISFDELQLIFKRPELLKKLETIVFPLLIQDIRNWKNSLGHVEMAFIESATAADKPEFDAEYDEILMIQAPLEIRTLRNPKAAERDTLQKCWTDRARQVIENTGTIKELHKKIDELYENRSC